MTIRFNGVEIPDEAVAREAAIHTDQAAPEQIAGRALAIRELLLQRARTLGVQADATAASDEGREDARIEAVLAQEVQTPEPTEAECRMFYQRNRQKFVSGELVEARHILFAVLPEAPLAAIRSKAEEILGLVRNDPEDFSALAETHSNCPSAAMGGNLGQISPGQTVPEFEQALFGTQALVGVLPDLVKSRYGFHVVKIEHREPGRSLPFERVHERIADYLREQVRRRAIHQYVRILAGQADIAGVDLDPAQSPLLQ